MKALLNNKAKFLSEFVFADVTKKVILIGVFVLSNFAVAQTGSDNPYVYESSDEVSDNDTYPGNPGDPFTAPIDDYIPALFILGAALVVVASVKKKSNVE